MTYNENGKWNVWELDHYTDRSSLGIHFWDLYWKMAYLKFEKFWYSNVRPWETVQIWGDCPSRPTYGMKSSKKWHVFEELSLRSAVCDKYTVARSVAFIPQSQFFRISLQLVQKNFPNKSGLLSSLASGHPLHFIIFPFHTSVPILNRTLGLAKYFPIAKRVWVQKVWKVDTIWEMQFRWSKTCRLLVDAVHILATGHRGQEFPVSRPLTWPRWVYYITCIVISPISPSKHGTWPRWVQYYITSPTSKHDDWNKILSRSRGQVFFILDNIYVAFITSLSDIGNFASLILISEGVNCLKGDARQ